MDRKNTEPISGKLDHFYGDRSVVLSIKQLETVKTNLITKGLFISDIGFYPHARNHLVHRNKGIDQQVLLYCIDGKGMIQIQNQHFTLRAHEFFIIQAGEEHKYWSDGNTPWSIYWLHFGGDLTTSFSDFFGRIIRVGQSVFDKTDDRLKLFNEILTALESGFTTENVNYANMCLYGLLASFFYIETFSSVKGYHSTNPVEQVIAFMHEHIEEMLTIKDMARHVNLSESHFSKVFRNKTGSSPLDYFISLKMQEAIRLLTNQSLKIKEVAFKLGYSDAYYFTRIFTRQIGSSPGSFAKTNRH
jgi:AraC family transcriptional regulator, arabinose operon regulatory protein